MTYSCTRQNDGLRAHPSAAVVAATAFALLTAGAAQAQCGALKDSDRNRLRDYAQKKYKLPGTNLTLADVSSVGGTCYRKLTFRLGDQGREFVVYSSPDLRFVSRDLSDSTIDPVEEERRKQEALEAGLTSGPHPTRGPDSAPVTITVFSDFACPFCSKIHEELRDGIVPLEKGNVRIVYRFLPLPMHPWARAAADAAACAFEQKNEYFWSLHDYLFDHRQELTTSNLKDKVTSQAEGLVGLDKARFGTCLAERDAAGQVDKDVAFARESGISATPTMFVNGHRLEGALPPEQILTLIHQLGPKAQANADPAGR